MAITFVGSAVATAIDGGTATVTFPGGVLQNDIVVLFHGYPVASIPALISGYTAVTTATSGINSSIRVSYSVMGASPDTSVACPGTGNVADVNCAAVLIFRGVDTATPLDVAATTATAVSAADAPSITPTSDNCAIAIGCMSPTDDSTPGTVTSYTSPTPSTANATDTNSGTVAVAYRLLSGGAGAGENPVAWSAFTSARFVAATVALRPSTVVTVPGPLSEPVRRKPTIYPDSLFFHPFPITVANYGWLRPLSEPVRRKPTVFPDSSFFHPFPITVANYEGRQPLSEPVRRKPTTYPDSLFFHPFPITVANFEWRQPLSEPIRRKPTIFPDSLFFHPFPVTVANFEWRQPLSQPRAQDFVAKAFSVALMASGLLVPVPAAETVTIDKWFAPAQAPTRQAWSPARMEFTWLPPSGEASPTPPAATQKDGDPDYWKLPWLKVADKTFVEKLRAKTFGALEEAAALAAEAEPAKAKRAVRKAAKGLNEYVKTAGALLSDDAVAELGQTAKQLNYMASQWDRAALLAQVSTARRALWAYEAQQLQQEQDDEDALIALLVT